MWCDAALSRTEQVPIELDISAIEDYILLLCEVLVCVSVIYNMMATTMHIIKYVCESNNSCIANNMLTGTK